MNLHSVTSVRLTVNLKIIRVLRQRWKAVMSARREAQPAAFRFANGLPLGQQPKLELQMPPKASQIQGQALPLRVLSRLSWHSSGCKKREDRKRNGKSDVSGVLHCFFLRVNE